MFPSFPLYFFQNFLGYLKIFWLNLIFDKKFMDSEAIFTTYRSELVKDYLKEALALCISCTDLKIDDSCAANCSSQYISFLYGKKLVEQKLNQCKNSCYAVKNTAEQTKCLNNCFAAAKLDLFSLDKLLNI